jgi:hypothetical protein
MTEHEEEYYRERNAEANADAREGKAAPLRWEFGEREWQAAGAQQEITDADGEHVGWIECYQGDEANARLACAAPAFARACLGTGAPGEPTPLDALDHLLDSLKTPHIPDPWPARDACACLARELRAAVGRATQEDEQ